MSEVDAIGRLNQIARMFGDANEHVAMTAFGRYRSALRSSGLHPEDFRIEDARGADFRRDRRLVDGLKAKVDELQQRLAAYERVTTPGQQKEAEHIAKVRNRWPEFLVLLRQRWPIAPPTNAELARLLRINGTQFVGCQVGTFQITDAMLRRLADEPIPPPRKKKLKPKSKLTLVDEAA